MAHFYEKELHYSHHVSKKSGKYIKGMRDGE